MRQQRRGESPTTLFWVAGLTPAATTRVASLLKHATRLMLVVVAEGVGVLSVRVIAHTLDEWKELVEGGLPAAGGGARLGGDAHSRGGRDAACACQQGQCEQPGGNHFPGEGPLGLTGPRPRHHSHSAVQALVYNRYRSTDHLPPLRSSVTGVCTADGAVYWYSRPTCI